MRSAATVLLFVVIAAAARLDPVAAHNPITTKVTWTREISALLERRCTSCHHAGGYAGFALTSYDAARPWAVAIKEVVLAGDMPPWGAAAGVGHFANDRRLTRHEQELIAAWVDGGAPYSPEARTPAFAASTPNRQLPTPNRQLPTPNPQLPTPNPQFPTPNIQSPTPNIQLPTPNIQSPTPNIQSPTPNIQSPTSKTIASAPPVGGLAVPLAPATIDDAIRRTASVTLQLPAGMSLTAWTFEPGLPFSVERVDLEVGSRWLGTWTPGERSIEFPDDAGVPLTTSALFTARIEYRAPAAPAVDQSRLRVWITKDTKSKTVREAVVVRSWRAAEPVNLVALRPSTEARDVEVIARLPNGGVEAVAALVAPSRGAHPTYQLTRPLSLPAGARIEATSSVHLLYTAAATRTMKPNVRRRPRR